MYTVLCIGIKQIDSYFSLRDTSQDGNETAHLRKHWFKHTTDKVRRTRK